MEISQEVAVVTGGAQGIGRAIVELLLDSSYAVVIADMDGDRAEKTAKEIGIPRDRCWPVRLDVTDGKQVSLLMEQILKDWGRIDALINNAGITRDGLLVRMREEDWNAVLNVNLKGTYHCTKAVLASMSKRRKGSIVSIASIVGAIGNAGQANYAASKAAVIGFTKTVAREYASRGVTVNAVAPGFIDTAMTQKLQGEARERLIRQIPLGRLGTALDVANAVRFLLSKEASYMTGQVLHVNGGMFMS